MRRSFLAASGFLVLVAGAAECVHAEDKVSMLDRIENSRNKAMAAINDKSTGKKSKKKKDPSLENAMGSREFRGSGDLNLNKKAATALDFRVDQKVRASDYKVTRSFFGVKNPWLGRKVYEADAAGLFSKSLVPNADRKIDAGKAPTRGYAQEEKSAAVGDEIVKTRPYLGQGAAQGSLDRVTEHIGKDMTIEQVRELLNKGH